MAGRSGKSSAGRKPLAGNARMKIRGVKTPKPGDVKTPMSRDAARNAALIARFYAAFGRRDAEGMIACYASDASFSDPVFTHLDYAGVCAMWRMLCARGKDLQVKASGIDADVTDGRAHWTASYTDTATGRRVANEIDAAFRFRDGKIASHRDSFDLWRWSRQALGPVGWVIGLPGLRRTIRKKAAETLEAYRTKTKDQA